MQRLLLLAITAVTLLIGANAASAHCESKNGHQDAATQTGTRH
jgi:hypothetical protein